MNLISSMDLSKDAINRIFEIADDVSTGNEEISLKEHSTMVLYFEEPSTRTRVSFEVAIAKLGGTPIYVDAHTTQVSRGETIADTAKVLSSYCDFIIVRMNDHDKLLTIAENSKVPVINALTYLEHPTQALADCYTILKHKKSLKKLKIAFVGDIATNTANSLMITAVKLGAEIVLIGPNSVKPNTYYYTKAREYGSVELFDSLELGLEGVDIIYTDTFVSMGDESNASQRLELFAPYQLNSKVLSYANKDALVMHCLPAHRGEEITADVLDSDRSIVWEQAANKLIIEKAILLYLSEKH
ncbi:MAG: ornithine carbamoyltransferase [Candidatus Micrarchaeaceae archaeon]